MIAAYFCYCMQVLVEAKRIAELRIPPKVIFSGMLSYNILNYIQRGAIDIKNQIFLSLFFHELYMHYMPVI